MKTFVYTKIVDRYYCEYSDEHEEEEFEFEYTVSDQELREAVVDCVNEYYFEGKLNKKHFKNFIRDADILDELVEIFEDELKEYFKEEAFETLE